MTKRALKRQLREGAFDADQFDDGKVRRLPVERGWTPPMQAYGSHQNTEEREQGYLKTIKPKSIGQTHLLEAIEAARHRTARQLELGGERAGRAPMLGLVQHQCSQDLPIRERQAMLGQDLFHALLDPAVDPGDPADDRLHLEVDAQLDQWAEALDEAVDVVLFAHCGNSCHHFS